MVRILEERTFVPDKKYIEAVGLSTDTKPTEGLVTGSTFIEVDTGKVYIFDEVSATWNQFGS